MSATRRSARPPTVRQRVGQIQDMVSAIVDLTQELRVCGYNVSNTAEFLPDLLAADARVPGGESVESVLKRANDESALATVHAREVVRSCEQLSAMVAALQKAMVQP